MSKFKPGDKVIWSLQEFEVQTDGVHSADGRTLYLALNPYGYVITLDGAHMRLVPKVVSSEEQTELLEALEAAWNLIGWIDGISPTSDMGKKMSTWQARTDPIIKKARSAA